MAANKSTRNPKPRSRFTRFPEVRGKIVSEVEIDPDANAILILFEDMTALSFDLDSSHVIFPELLNRKRGNWEPIKHWPPIYSPVSMVK
ncbi:MAG TPA: hypothetical protein VFF39_16195 [Verrucomicrobiae bacterium]|jgi:hypothetical protein|nr:hypothetical protein [Verrucomicrobiae bacterium]